VDCLENTVVYAVANLCQSILTIEFLGLGGRQNSEGRSAALIGLKYNVPMSTSRRGTGRGGVFAR